MVDAVEIRGQKRSQFSTELFTKKSCLIHGDKYNYSKVVYKNAITKVIVTCPLHGDFDQTPNCHIRGRGCRVCATTRNAQNKNREFAENFVISAQEKHGDRYDYSESVYVSSMDKIIIICRLHGKFEQTPDSHLQGKGCSFCGGNYKSDNTDFIRKAIIKHGDVYDYSKVMYSNAKTVVSIICKVPDHGEFLQIPNSHLNGYGCFKCGHKMTIFNTEKFIEEAKKVHESKYDYSKSTYSKMQCKLTIGCRIHGDFEQSPSNHINQKQGCQQCAQNYVSTTGEFIEKAKKIHGEKYTYDKVFYVNNHSKVTITCGHHGDFDQTPQNHLTGSACYQCGKKMIICTKDEFIKKADEIHKNEYDYRSVEFKTLSDKVLIICGKHGSFYQRAGSHLSGKGCRKCYSSYSRSQIHWLEFIALFNGIEIQHVWNDGEFVIPETRYQADGYCKETNTIYEYHGDYWHGNPKKYDKDDVNKTVKKTFGELYDLTMMKETRIKELGYNLVVMWESDWLKLNRAVHKLQQKKTKNKWRQ